MLEVDSSAAACAQGSSASRKCVCSGLPCSSLGLAHSGRGRSNRQLLFLYVLRSGGCSAPTGQWVACELLKSGASQAQSAVKAGGSRRRTSDVGSSGASVTQNESGARLDALVAFRSSGGVGRCPCR